MDSPSALHITLCFRPVPARKGEVHSVTTLLRNAGHCVQQKEDGPLGPDHQDVIWIMENICWFPIIVKQLQACPKPKRPFVIVWHWEPLPPSKASGQPYPKLHLREIAKIILRDLRATDIYTNARRLRQLAREDFIDLLVVSSQAWRNYLQESQINAHWAPIGYEPSDGCPMHLPRDIDVLFLGTLDVPRRKAIIQQLRKKQIAIQTIGSWFDPDCWGKSRTQTLNRAKILLNIQRQPSEIAAHRLILGMANQALVISEPINDPTPFIPGKHYISASVAEMPQVITDYLRHNEKRMSITKKAYQFITKELTMQQSVDKILRLIAKSANKN